MEEGLYRLPNGFARTLSLFFCIRFPMASAKQDPIVRILSEIPIFWGEDTGLTTVRKWLIKIMFPQTLENLALFKIL
jgi:hypothetical protein